jgi:hypothetical protein
MPSYIEEPEAAGCKWVSIRERNREKYDLPTVFSVRSCGVSDQVEIISGLRHASDRLARRN